jgi:hypothetical protein
MNLKPQYATIFSEGVFPLRAYNRSYPLASDNKTRIIIAYGKLFASFEYSSLHLSSHQIQIFISFDY